jgi:hypothetical protein
MKEKKSELQALGNQPGKSQARFSSPVSKPRHSCDVVSCHSTIYLICTVLCDTCEVCLQLGGHFLKYIKPSDKWAKRETKSILQSSPLSSATLQFKPISCSGKQNWKSHSVAEDNGTQFSVCCFLTTSILPPAEGYSSLCYAVMGPQLLRTVSRRT